jgi:hypothetical protein
MAKYSGELYDAPPTVERSVPPPVADEVAAPVIAAPAGNPAMDAAFAKGAEELKKDYEKKVEDTTTDKLNIAGNEFSLPSFFNSPAGYVAGLGLATLLGARYIPPAIAKAKDIKNRYLSSLPQNNLSNFQNYLDTRIEPTLGTPAAPSTVLNLDDIKARMAGVTSDPVLSDSLLPKAAPVFDDPILRTPEIDRNIPAYLRQGQPFAGTTPIAPLAPAMAAPIPETTPETTPITYVQPGQSFADVTPLTAPETTPITSSAAPNSDATKAVTGLLTEEIKAAGAPETKVTSAPEPKVAGASVPETTVVQPVSPPEGAAPAYNQRVKKAMEGVPESVKAKYAQEGKVVLKGYGVGDRSLTNTYGPEAYAKIIDYFNNGQPIGSDANYQAVQKKINKGIPSSLAAEFATKLPGSEAEAGNFGKSFGDVGAYTPEGKVVTSPAAMKNAVAKGGAIFLAASVPNALLAAQQGNYGKLAELGFDVGTSAIPYVGAALTALTGTGANAPTLRSDPYAEVLNRPGVRQTLQSMSQTMSPSQFNVARDQYLSKISQFPEINTARVTKPIIGSSRPLNPNTLLPVPPPR